MTWQAVGAAQFALDARALGPPVLTRAAVNFFCN